jgi:hypothetical protein
VSPAACGVVCGLWAPGATALPQLQATSSRPHPVPRAPWPAGLEGVRARGPRAHGRHQRAAPRSPVPSSQFTSYQLRAKVEVVAFRLLGLAHELWAYFR